MSTTFFIHIEPADHELVWWAENPDIAGLTAAADSLADLTRLIEEASVEHLPDEEIVLLLVGDEEQATADPDESPVFAPPVQDRGVPTIRRLIAVA
jgi:predicted RNase H-like HicB family nuclease